VSDGITKHHDRDDLHGITVVVTGTSGATYVGRWHERQPRGVVLRDVATLAAGQDVDAWLAKLVKFGVPPEERLLVLPHEEVGEVRRLDL
jgi:hypothetical protein